MEIWTIDRERDEPVYRQLVRRVREAVLAGVLAPGHRLPTEHALARRLTVARSTVTAAYNELKAQGYLESSPGRGTFVAREPAGEPLWWGSCLARSEEVPWDPLGEASAPALVSFMHGNPPIDVVPVTDFRDAVSEAADDPDSYSFSPPMGDPRLREALAAISAPRLGRPVAVEEVLITSGVQHALHLLARLLITPGDHVAMPAITYYGASVAFREAGGRVLTLETSPGELDVDRLAGLLTRSRVRAVYVNPLHGNPFGVSLAEGARRALGDLCGRYRVPVIEDESYAFLSSGADAPPGIAAGSPPGAVVPVWSVSKPLAPGVRLGWLVAPPAVVNALAVIQRDQLLHPGTLIQRALARFVASGRWQNHVERVRKAFTERRRTAVELLRAGLPPGFKLTSPDGGLFAWATLPRGLREHSFLTRALASGVAFAPGRSFLADPADQEPGGMRLNVVWNDAATVREGILRLNEAYRLAA